MSQNIDEFNRACAALLAGLYATFPESHLVDIRAVCAQLARDAETEGEILARARVIASTLQFLDAEGFIRCGNHRGAYVENVTLSAKGLAVLNRTPDALRPAQKTVGDSLVDLARDLARDGVKEAAKAAILLVLGS